MKDLLRVLHLEDDKEDAGLIRSMLRSQFAACEIVVVDAKDAFVRELKSGKFDLIISDFTLPSFNGTAALGIAQDMCPDVPFLFVSGTLGEDPAIESLLNGATDYVPKLKMSRLIPAVRRALQESDDRKQRRRAEEELRRHFSAVEQSADSIVITDRNGTIEYVNPGFEKNTGYSREEAVGKTPKILKSGKHSQEFYKGLWETVLSGKVFYAQFQNKRKNGELYYQEETITPVLDSNGRVSHFVSTGRDITERKKSEEALRESEERFKMLFEFAPDACFMTDLEGVFVEANSAAELLTEYRREELVGKNFFKLDLMPVAEMARAAELLARNAGGQPGGPAEFTLRTKNRKTVTAEIRTIPVRLGDRLLVLGIAQNVTERRRAEQALRESEARYRRLFEGAVLGIFQTSPEGKLLAVNPAFARIFGYDSPDDAKACVKNVATDIFVDPERRSQLLRMIVQNPGLNTFENLYRRKDRSTFTGSLHVHLVKDAKGRLEYIEGVVEDISERKRAEEALRESEFWTRESQRVARIGSYATDFIAGRWTSSEVLDDIFDIDKSFERTVAGWASLIHPDDRDMMMLYLNDIVARQLPFQKDYRIVRKSSGEVRWVSGRGELEFNNKGELLRMFGTIQDITEGKKAEEELRESKDQYRELVENINDIIYAADDKGIITYISPVVEALGGYKQSDLLGRSLSEFVHPDDLRELQLNRERALGGVPLSYEYRVKTKTGKWRWVRSSTHPTRDGKGLRGILSDVTERKQSENLLRESEERFRSVWEHSADGMRLMDRAGRIIEVNEAFCRLVGIPREKLLGKVFSVTYKEGGQDGNLKIYQEHFDAGAIEPHLEVPVTLWNGRVLDLEISHTFIETAGHERMVLSIFRDITERKSAEMKLRLSEEIIHRVNSLIVLADSSGNITYVSPSIKTVLGYDAEEVLGDGWWRLTRDDPEAGRKEREIAARTARGELPIEQVPYEKKLRAKDGSIRWILWRDAPGLHQEIYGVGQDITERKIFEDHMRQVQKMESIGTLAGGIAHDFNNILAIILGHASLLQRTPGDAAQFTESVASINKAVERGASLVRQILTFARKAEPRLEPVRINGTIKELAKMLGETFPKTVSLTLRLDDDLPVISMDPSQFHQALLNLCVNARDAMNGKGSLTIATEIVGNMDVAARFPTAQAPRYVRVSVADTGVGMDKETMSRIFEPFFTSKEEGKGTGLGLAVVYGVMQAHGGFVDVESSPGAGTTFHLLFPLPDDVLVERKAESNSREEVPQGTETILIAEDEEALGEILAGALREQGYKIILARDGEEAVKLFSDHRDEVALVLSDMGLPRLSGSDAVRIMLENKPGLRALLASGYLDPDDRPEVLKLGLSGFIQKPYRIEEVVKKIRETLDRRP